MGGILVLVLSLSVAATQDKPVTPAEQYRDGQDYLDTLRRQDRAKAVAEVEAVFEQAADKYGDVKLPFGGTVGDKAKMELFAIRHLAVGKEAPAIEGPDQNGVRFKLSDYRGKVVLLYFW